MTEYDNLSPESGLPQSKSEPEPMTPDELARYRELLKLAYPQPQRNLSAAVMAQIRQTPAETAGTKVKAGAGKNLRRAFVRWGSLAACAALVLLIGTTILPSRLTDKTANAPALAGDFDYSAADSQAAPTEAAPEPSPSPNVFDGSAPSPEESGSAPTKRAAVTESAAVQEIPEAEAAPAETKAKADTPAANGFYMPEEAVCEEEVCEEAVCSEAAAVASDECEIPAGAPLLTASGGVKNDLSDSAHRCEYSAAFRDCCHNIPAALTDPLGEEWYVWCENRIEAGACVNLADFLVDFGLTAAEVHQTGNLWYYLDVPEEIPFTEENREAVRDYYRQGGSYAEMVRRYTEYEFRTALIAEVGVMNYTAWAKNAGADPSSYRSWRIRQLTDAFALPEDRVRSLFDRAAAQVGEEFPGYALPSPEELLEN